MNILGFEVSRDDMMKAFAAIIVIAFVLEGIAINQQNATTSGTKTTTASSLETFVGTGTGNATIVSYDPGLIVTGDNYTDAEIASLEKEGIVSYSSKSSDGTIVSLSSRTALPEVVSRLLAANATLIYDYASVTFSNVKVQGTGFTRNVSAQTLRVPLQPYYEIGDTLSATFQAQVQDGQLVYVPGLQLAPEAEGIAYVKPASLSITGEFLMGQVPWSMRNSINQSALTDAFKGYNVTYKKRSYVYFETQPTSAQAQQLTTSLPTYALAYQSGIMSIAGQFNDTGKITSDMAAYGLVPVFSPSLIEIRGGEGIGNATAKVLNISGIEGNFTNEYDISATLPSTIAANGKNYTLPQNIVSLQAEAPPRNTSLVEMLYMPQGRVITSVLSAQLVVPIPAVIPNATASFPPANSTAVNSTIAANATNPAEANASPAPANVATPPAANPSQASANATNPASLPPAANASPSNGTLSPPSVPA